MRYIRQTLYAIAIATLLIFTMSQARALEQRPDGSVVLTAEEVAAVEWNFNQALMQLQAVAAELEATQESLRVLRGKTGCN